MSERIDIRIDDDPRDVIHRAVERLAAGGVVGLPTETGYVAACQSTQPHAVDKVAAIAGPVALAIRGADEALDFAPLANPLGQRMFQRLWPGPFILELLTGYEPGLTAAFGTSVQQLLTADGRLRLRHVGHDVFDAIQRLLPAPLIITADEDTTPDRLLERMPGLDLLIDDGVPVPQIPVARIEVADGEWRLIGGTETSTSEIQEQLGVGILFLCTGNTCRSPLAEAMFRKLLAERLGCDEDELSDRGFNIASAGLAAVYGAPAAEDSLALAKEFGLKLTRHRSQPVTDELLRRSDYIFVMTGGHRNSLLSARPELADRVQLISREGMDIADPIGGGREEYERCRAELERELLVLVDTLPLGLERGLK